MTKGFTLLEFIIYAAVSGILLLTMGAISMNIISGRTKLLTFTEMNQNVRLIMEEIADNVGKSEGIIVPAQSATSSTLSLKTSDPLLDPTEIYLSNSTVKIKKGLNSPIDLTTDEVLISELQFLNVAYPNTSGTVRVTLKIRPLKILGFEKVFNTTIDVKKY
ncbi:MAG: hypothetical protein AAB890_01140 [Patescibacteria group bacterium]